eukprot:TRINITY_DN2254_c0_g1_i2.p1 TRINITY_DN2254_c0_g1~~TRINITY_DN2254_c0_g1_i2.p1  ORF type:complete len:307 (-),score=66.46 TRINITY_DN2254_c0_g1_i2:26-946(-)
MELCSKEIVWLCSWVACRGTEKNVMPTFKANIQQLDKTKIPADGATFKITSIEHVKGDMDVCNRRGKIIFIYDCTIKIKWRGIMRKDGEKITGKGTLEIVDIDNSNEFFYKYTQESQNSKNKELLSILKRAAPTFFNSTLLDIIETMRLALTSPSQTENMESPDQVEPKRLGSLINDIVIGTTAENIYKVFTDSQMLSSLTDTHCDIELVQGSQFYLLEGGVSGTVVTFSPNKHLEYRWRFSDWQEDLFSTVTMTLEETGPEKTLLKFKHDGIPDEQISRTSDIWESCFWSKLPLVFGWPINETQN